MTRSEDRETASCCTARAREGAEAGEDG
ncbi:unnamed protein product [Tetraodon nigroviridis]|uniref:(spotted green pufferfish) hypothetical protein n=1 Tax=Tetraodon nigroviridis TaxID=99883 RepID=Q4RM87_TETNG|nr:unnamed protein product [Tetraodon nigroviridis]